MLVDSFNAATSFPSPFEHATLRWYAALSDHREFLEAAWISLQVALIAAALATMDVLEREGIANAAKMGDAFFDRLRDWPAKHPIVGDVRGRGLMIGIEIVKSQQTREPAPVLRDRIVSLAFEKGLLLLGCGETSLRLAPPLILNQQEATIGLDILEQCLRQTEQEHAQAASFAAATV